MSPLTQGLNYRSACDDAESPKDGPFGGFDDKNIVQGIKTPKNTPKSGRG